MLTTDILSWKKLSERQQKPVHLILFITDHCNAKCGTCFYWQNLNQGEALQPDIFKRFREAMGELVWLDISGGEPFLRKDIDQICHRFLDHNQAKFINIPTNALQTDVIRKSVEGILANPNKFRLNIAISLDGIGEVHDKIRGVPGNYKRAMATMEALREIRTRDKRLSLSVVSTVMSSNIEDIKRLLHLGVDRLGPGLSFAQHPARQVDGPLALGAHARAIRRSLEAPVTALPALFSRTLGRHRRMDRHRRPLHAESLLHAGNAGPPQEHLLQCGRRELRHRRQRRRLLLRVAQAGGKSQGL